MINKHTIVDEIMTDSRWTEEEKIFISRSVYSYVDLLEACKYAFKNLSPKGNIKKDYSGHLAVATLSKAIEKGEGR